MTITLCVLLWSRPGLERELTAYEDEVLALLGDHGGRVLRRAVLESSDDQPAEVQLIEFDGAAGIDAYLADPRRTGLAAVRDRVIARTEMMRVAALVGG